MDNSVKEVVRFSSSDLKKLKFFVFFAALIILAQVFQFVNTKRLDNTYNTMLANENRLIVGLNAILFQSAAIHRSLLNLEISHDLSEMNIMNQRILDSEKKTEEAVILIEKNNSELKVEFADLFNKLKSYGKDYVEKSHEFKRILFNSDKASIDKYRVNVLRPCLDSYQQVQNDLLQKITNKTIDESENISSKATKTGWILLIGGNAILFLVMTFLIYLLLKPNNY